MNAQTLAHTVTTRNFLSLPDVVLRLNQLLERPDATNAAIAELLMSDPALSARVLKLANSASYAAAGKVATISKAVSVLGIGQIRSLTMTSFVAQAFRGIPAEWVDMEKFWLNSVATAVIARALAVPARLFDPERLFLAGLLLKLGRLVFCCCRPEDYVQVLRVRDEGERRLSEEERQVFGYGYAELSAELMKIWQLPETLYRIVEHFRDPLAELDDAREVAIVRVASELALAIEPGRQSAEAFDPDTLALDAEAMGTLGLSVEGLPNLMLDAWLQTFEIMGIIRPDMAHIY